MNHLSRARHALHSALALSLLGAVFHTQAAATDIQLFPDELVAKGKGFEIRHSKVEDALATLKANAAAQGQTVNENRPGELETKMIDRLILHQMLLQKATAEDHAKAKESADRIVTDSRLRSPSEASFNRQLLAAGLTREKFQKMVLDQAIAERVLERELKAKITVTPEQIKAFYDEGIDLEARELQATVDKLAKSAPQTSFHADGKRRLAELKKANLARLDRPEQVRVSHILFYTLDPNTREELSEDAKKAKKEKLQKVRERLNAGEDFAKVAKEVSEDPEVQQTGGEYVVSREATMAPEIKGAVFSMQVNQVSDIITTAYGLHLAKVLEKIPAGKIPFPKAEPDLKDYLLNQELQRQLPSYFAQLKKDFGVEILAPAPAQ